MLQNTSEQQICNLGPIHRKTGLIFVLPQPVIYHKNNPYNISNSTNQNQDSFQNQKIYPNIHSSKLKKKTYKIRSISTLQNHKSKNQQNKYQQQKSILRQTLYRKFVQKSRSTIISHDSKIQQKLPTNHTNIKLRQLNLVVLSKRQQLKKTIKNKDDKQKQKISQKYTKITNLNGISLPRFGKSKSSFYKLNTRQQNSLAFLSKTIFSQIQTHFTAHFPKNKASQPLQLGISKIKITDKNFDRNINIKNRRLLNVSDHDNQKYLEFQVRKEMRDVNFLKNWNENINYKGRKQTQLKGWEEQAALAEYNNFTIQP